MNWHFIPNYGDERQVDRCVYCGGFSNTNDHVPSKVFLDEPYPLNLPFVPACQSCNEGFSLDEEYTACLIECAMAGSTNIKDLHRKKVIKILEQKPALVSKLNESSTIIANKISFIPEINRITNIGLKLARGHVAFELNEPQLEAPSHVAVIPISDLTVDARDKFETPPNPSILPEVGSRAFQRLVVDNPGTTIWVVVQPSRYRYLTSLNGTAASVRFVISEYLAGEVTWQY